MVPEWAKHNVQAINASDEMKQAVDNNVDYYAILGIPKTTPYENTSEKMEQLTMGAANRMEETKISKLRTVIPTSTYSFIAVAARQCEKYGDLIQLVETQIMDPFTGIMKREKVTGLSAVTKSDSLDTSKWSAEDVEQLLTGLGVDCTTEDGQWALDALGKGRGTGKGFQGTRNWAPSKGMLGMHKAQNEKRIQRERGQQRRQRSNSTKEGLEALRP